VSSNFSRQKLGKRRMKQQPKCACCPELAIHHLTWQNGWFRGDDDDELACDTHMQLARTDSREFFRLKQVRTAHLDTIVDAQHEETGREWRGTRRCLPPRYVERPPQVTT
jgi:hypothetical protein